MITPLAPHPPRSVLGFMIWNRLAGLFLKTIVAGNHSLRNALVAGSVDTSHDDDDPADKELLLVLRILQRLPSTLRAMKQAEVRGKGESFKAMPDLGAPSFASAPAGAHRSGWCRSKHNVEGVATAPATAANVSVDGDCELVDLESGDGQASVSLDPTTQEHESSSPPSSPTLLPPTEASTTTIHQRRRRRPRRPRRPRR